MSSDGRPLLEVTDLVKHFPINAGILFDRQIGAVKAVDGVSFTVAEGETLGLVGESGCGKSTLCRTILHLIDPTSGTVNFDGQEVSAMSRARCGARCR
jgi:oligopeptide transport system ATP-binding protein